MASRKTLLVAAAMALVATAALLPTTASKRFIVGDADGWATGVDYAAWTKGKKFRVGGDVLLFQYNDPGLDLVLVDEQSFANCTPTANSELLGSGSSAAVKLGKADTFFFICDAEGACESGMKLAIKAVN